MGREMLLYNRVPQQPILHHSLLMLSLFSLLISRLIFCDMLLEECWVWDFTQIISKRLESYVVIGAGSKAHTKILFSSAFYPSLDLHLRRALQPICESGHSGHESLAAGLFKSEGPAGESESVTLTKLSPAQAVLKVAFSPPCCSS